MCIIIITIIVAVTIVSGNFVVFVYHDHKIKILVTTCTSHFTTISCFLNTNDWCFFYIFWWFLCVLRLYSILIQSYGIGTRFNCIILSYSFSYVDWFLKCYEINDSDIDDNNKEFYLTYCWMITFTSEIIWNIFNYSIIKFFSFTTGAQINYTIITEDLTEAKILISKP